MPITNVAVDLDAVRLQQEQIYLHIGKYTVASVELDHKLTSFFGALVTPDQKFRSGKAIRDEQVSAKLRIIERVLPSSDDWPDLRTFLSAIESTVRYRNRLAHSLPSALIGVTTGEVAWGTRRERKGLAFEPIDPLQLEVEERAVRIILALLDELISLDPCITDMSADDLRKLSVRDLLLDSALGKVAVNNSELMSAVDFLFPPNRPTLPRELQDATDPRTLNSLKELDDALQP